MRNSKGIGPSHPAVIGQTKVTVSRSRSRVPSLVNIAMPGAGRGVDGHPGLVAADRWADHLPTRPAIRRAPNVAQPGRRVQEAQVIKAALRVAGQDRVAAKDVGLEHAAKSPG